MTNLYASLRNIDAYYREKRAKKARNRKIRAKIREKIVKYERK